MNGRSTSKFHVDGKPPIKEVLPLGLQHLMAMIVGNIVPAMLISSVVGLNQLESTILIQGAMLAAGLATLLQVYPIPLFGGYRIGSRLPLVMGAGYVFLGASISVASQYGLAALFGAQIGGAIVVFIFGFGIKKVRHIFTPVISGTIVACMGISLFPSAMNNLAGGAGSPIFGQPINFIIGGSVILITVTLMKFGKGILKDASILIGILSGYLISLPFEIIDFSKIQGASILAIPTPFAFGLEFRLDLILMFALMYIISIADLMGSATVVTIGAMDREVRDDELSSTVMGSAISSIIAAMFSSIPTAVCGQNSAIVSMNKVTSRYVIASTGIMLISIGFSPLLGAFISTIPSCVVGGATLVVFSSIAMTGYSIINIDGFTPDNNLIAGVSIAVSIGFTTVPEVLHEFPMIVNTLIGESSIVSGAIIALFLKWIFSINESKDMKQINIDGCDIKSLESAQ